MDAKFFFKVDLQASEISMKAERQGESIVWSVDFGVSCTPLNLMLAEKLTMKDRHPQFGSIRFKTS
jgi:hypothetical protein